MKSDEKLQLILIILLPLVLGLFLTLNPLDQEIRELWKENRLALKTQDYEQILSVNQDIQNLQPWRESEMLSLARANFQLGEWQETIDAYLKVSAESPLSLEDTYSLAEAYWETDQMEKARLTWNQIRDREDIRESDLEKLVSVQQDHQDYYQAYQTLLTWKTRFPLDNTLYYALGLSQIIYDPENAESSLLRSLETYQERIDQVSALREGLAVILRETDAAARLMIAGNVLSQQSEWAYAAGAYAVVTRSIPDYAEAWALYGNAMYYLGENGDVYIQKAVDLDPQSQVVKAVQAYAYRREGRAQEAIRIFEDLSKQNPDNALWIYEIGQTYNVMGELGSALVYYQQAALIDESDPYYWEALARFSLENSFGLESVGIDAARKALTLQPEDGLTNDLMGWFFYTLDDLVSAERFLLKAKQYAPYSAVVHLHLGQLYIQKNEYALADENLRACVEFAKNAQIKQQAVYLLENYLGN